MRKYYALILLLASLAGIVSGQTNTFPGTGRAGIGTTSPGADLHIRTDGTNSPWLALDKNAGQETGIQFRKSGSVMFYLYSDNTDNDALKIQSTAVSGEGDGSPRIYIPFQNKDLYLTTSGGNVAIGHKNPGYKLDVYAPQGSWKAKFHGEDGYILVGPANEHWAHFYTDRPNFLFNQNVYSIGGFSSYNTADLSLQTHGVTRVTVLKANGNVGIGTTTPGARLHVVDGDLLLQNQTSGYPRLWLKDVSGNNSMRLDYNSIIGSGGNLLLRSGAANALVLNDDGGNVGIGTTSPNEKLTVNGTIYGKEVKVDLSVPGPDYVFDEEYRLPSLEEVKAYIEQHKHLPEVPSAKAMEANGINLGEMNMLLLKKIEELTLYVIDLKEENIEIRKQLEKE